MRDIGVEPTKLYALDFESSPLSDSVISRMGIVGIKPASIALEAIILSLNYTPMNGDTMNRT